MDLCNGDDDRGKSMEVWIEGAGLGAPSPDANGWLCGVVGSMARMLIVRR